MYQSLNIRERHAFYQKHAFYYGCSIKYRSYLPLVSQYCNRHTHRNRISQFARLAVLLELVVGFTTHTNDPRAHILWTMVYFDQLLDTSIHHTCYKNTRIYDFRNRVPYYILYLHQKRSIDRWKERTNIWMQINGY